jgi:hypothetical protein
MQTAASVTALVPVTATADGLEADAAAVAALQAAAAVLQQGNGEGSQAVLATLLAGMAAGSAGAGAAAGDQSSALGAHAAVMFDSTSRAGTHD